MNLNLNNISFTRILYILYDCKQFLLRKQSHSRPHQASGITSYFPFLFFLLFFIHSLLLNFAVIPFWSRFYSSKRTKGMVMRFCIIKNSM